VVTGKKEEAGEGERGKNLVVIGVGAGLGAVGIGVGVGLFVAAGRKQDEADKTIADAGLAQGDCPGANAQDAAACTKLKGLIEDKDTFRNVGLPLIIAGGVIAAGTLTYALWPRKKLATVGLDIVSPVVSPTFAGAFFTGRF
jgi:hypothetical protein